jgi:hypothetical protein
MYKFKLITDLTNVTSEEKELMFNSAKSFFDLFQGMLADGRVKNNYTVKESILQLEWNPAKDLEVNKGNLGMMLEVELFDNMPNRFDLVQSVFENTLFQGKRVEGLIIQVE